MNRLKQLFSLIFYICIIKTINNSFLNENFHVRLSRRCEQFKKLMYLI